MSGLLSAAGSVLVHGLAYAMVLYIITVGLSVTMGLMRFANLAHGVFAVAGGYVLTRSMRELGVPFELGLLLAFLVVALGGVVLERLLYRRLYGASELDQLLLSIGLIFVSVAAAKFAFGPQPEHVALPAYLRQAIAIGDHTVPAYRIFVIVVGLLLALALWLGVERTLFGARVRAAVDNAAMSHAVGINTQRLFALVFALGSGLAGLGGALGAELIPINPMYPLAFLVIFLTVVSVGGLGSIRGAFLAALILGIGDTLTKFVLPSLGGFFFYAAGFALLLWRPQGLAGKGDA